MFKINYILDYVFSLIFKSFIFFYYKATIVRPLWLAAEWTLFSCNDGAL